MPVGAFAVTRTVPLLAVVATSVFFVSFSSFAQESAPAASPFVDSRQQFCEVAGTVLSAATGQPLKKARVTLAAQDEDQAQPLVSVTDASGHFGIERIRPGRYTVLVERVGYVSQAYDQDQPDKPGAILTLEQGKKVTDMLFRLRNAGVISGRVTDEDGEPAQDVLVEVLQRVYSEGKPVIGAVQDAKTNDLGEYRVYGLSPGRYYVRASNGPGPEEMFVGKAGPQATAGYAPTFYPGTTDPTQAGALDVKAGDEVSGIDITLSTNRTYHVRGHVLNPLTSSPAEINVTLFPRGESAMSAPDMRGAQTDPTTGAFDIARVSPGSYVLTAMWPDEGRMRTATQDVDVQNANVDDVSIVLARGADISGRVSVEGKVDGQADGGRTRMVVTLTQRGRMFAGDSEASVKSDGSFLLSGVSDGNYMIHVGSSCSACYVKSVTAGGGDILGQGIQVSGAVGPSSVDIVYSSHTAKVSGVVTRDDGSPAAGALVVLVPDEPFRGYDDRYQTASTDQYGAFTMSGVAPGSYSAYAWERIEDGAYEDPEFVKQFEKKAEPIEVEENGSNTIQLKLIPVTADQQ